MKSKIAGLNAEFRRRETRLAPSERILSDEWAKYLVELDPLTRAMKEFSRLVPKLACLREELQTAHCLRHRSIDELVLNAIERDGVRRVVTLGAGYEMRPSRFASKLAGIQWVEVDQKEILERKSRILRKLGIDTFETFSLALNLRSDRLIALSEQPFWKKPTRSLFVAEGLVHYLSLQSFVSILEDIRELSPSASIVFSFMESGMYEFGKPIVGEWLQKMKEIPTLHFTRERLAQLLEDHSFSRHRFIDAEAQIREFAPMARGRPLSVSQEIVQAWQA